MPDQRLEQVNEFVRVGKIEEARQIIELVIREDRHNIPAWQLYADTWPKAKDKIRVWEACLRYNPGNLQAQQALIQLNANPTKIQAAQTKMETASRPRADRAQNSLTLWLFGFGIALFMIGSIVTLVALRGSLPKDPADYLHTQPVEYYLYVPEAYSADKEWPLFVGIHGAGGTGLDCWNLWQTYAEREGFILLCPSIPGDASGFYQDVGENTVWSAVGEVKKEYRVKQQMFLSGFSAGAFFIQGFTYHYPQYVSALSILSSGVYLNPRMFINLVPMLVVIGDHDHPDAVQSSSIFVSNLQKFGFDIQYIVLPGVGHAVTDEGIDLTIELFRRTAGK